jgi:transposase
MRFRLYPNREQEAQLLEHCAQARFVWNLALEQHSYFDKRYQNRVKSPTFASQCRDLTDCRGESGWLQHGSQTVQQQALRDLSQAWANFFKNPSHFGRPTWRKRGIYEGFRIVGTQAQATRRLSRKRSQVNIPKIGWVDYRYSCSHEGAKSYRVKRDPTGRWWISFALIPEEIPAPRNGEIVGIDMGVANSFSFSNGEHHHTPGLSKREKQGKQRLERRIARQRKGSKRREKTKRDLARLNHRGINRKKDFIEKLTTRVAQEYDTIRIEDLRIKNMSKSAAGTSVDPGKNVAQKRGLNRSILGQGWGLFAERLQHKAGDRVELVAAAHTSTTCSACGHADKKNRESQAVFVCTACGTDRHADTNAAINIAAGHAVTGRGATRKTRLFEQQATKRQPTRKRALA